MERGNRLEPIARKALTTRTGITYFPAVFVSDSERLLASLDGLALGRVATCEIKCPEKGKESKLWKNIETGKLPKSHWEQMQLGLLLSGAPVCHYWVYDAVSGEGLYKEVLPNEDYFMKILTQAKNFRAAKEANSIGPSNVSVIDDDESLKLASYYEEVCKELKRIENAKEAIATKLEGMFPLGSDRAIIGNLQLDKKQISGVIDYKSIVAQTAPHINVELYRKAPAKSEKITVKIVEGKEAA